MPYVQINLLEGRSEEQIEKLVEAITDAIVKIFGVPKEVVWIEFNEMRKNRFAQGGVLRSKRQP
jgi:4-oxalocrotonate tautomerase